MPLFLIKMKLNLIVAYDRRNGGIGNESGLLWQLRGDLKNFREITRDSIVVMGRKTWETIPKNLDPFLVELMLFLQKIPSDFNAPEKTEDTEVSCFWKH